MHCEGGVQPYPWVSLRNLTLLFFCFFFDPWVPRYFAFLFISLLFFRFSLRFSFLGDSDSTLIRGKAKLKLLPVRN